MRNRISDSEETPLVSILSTDFWFYLPVKDLKLIVLTKDGALCIEDEEQKWRQWWKQKSMHSQWY